MATAGPDAERVAQLHRLEGFLNAFLADPNRPFTPEQLIDYARAEPQVFPPGQGWQYSDTNTVLLGLVVEKVSGKPLQDFLRDEIFTPLHLDHTSLPTTAAFPLAHSQGYTVQTADGSEAIATDWDPSDAWAAGAMISTLDDLHVWAEAMANGQLLEPATQRQRLETAPVPGYAHDVRYGLGLFEIGGWIGHNGSLPGYQSVVMYLPDAQTTLVVLVNTDIPVNGGEASTAVAEAVTRVISPEHLYRLDKAN